MDLYLLQDPDSGEDNGFSTKVNLMHQSDLTMDGAKITSPKGLVEADIDGLSETVSRIDEEAAKLEADIEAGQKAQDETTATNKAEIEADLKSAVEEAAAARSAMDEATAASQKAQDEASEAGFKAATEARAAEKLARETVDASQAETANIDRAARIAADESHDTEIAAIK
jgi:septal ring factor EnvC (AmiA/AmiB activator)